MTCFHPLPAKRNAAGGKPTIYRRINAPAFCDIKLPCGKCIGCRLDRTSMWATRCLHESQLNDDNCFLTLTINPYYLQLQRPELVLPTLRVDKPEIRDDLTTGSNIAPERLIASQPQSRSGGPVDSSSPRAESVPYAFRLRAPPSMAVPDWRGGLSKEAHKDFIKRYRHHHGPLRYYMCGEYTKAWCPHYHYLIFGHNFKDRYYWKTSESGEKLYRSAELEKLWPWGHAWIGDVTYESCAYVAAYVMKKITGPKAETHYRQTDEGGNDYWLEPEFNEMSRRPGIGKEWWMKFNADIHTDDVVVKMSGGKIRPPRYYDKLLELMDPAAMAVIRMKREIRAKELAGDNTPARLADKETVTIAKMALKKRKLEDPQ